MPHDSQSVSETIRKEALGSLGGCLVEGNLEQRRRERRVRRRSLLISILVQAAAVALLILIPLFGKTEHLALAIATPIPPYGHPPHRSAGPVRPTTGRPHVYPDIFTFPSPTLRPVRPSNPGDGAASAPIIGSGEPEGAGPECTWCLDIGGRGNGPRAPQPNTETPSRPRVIREPSINRAMLIHRVEPIYPSLARQIHKEGRVEMRARIATDGTIQSLEIVSGDPIFYQSAKDAVSQWRYRPTVLNGQPVEIDTYITVIYTMSH